MSVVFEEADHTALWIARRAMGADQRFSARRESHVGGRPQRQGLQSGSSPPASQNRSAPWRAALRGGQLNSRRRIRAVSSERSSLPERFEADMAFPSILAAERMRSFGATD